ncbi:unnamed protein product [Calypogeia fissa]
MNGAVSMEELEIRHEGNRLFAEKKWAAAVEKYSECINLNELDSIPSPQTASKKSLSRFLTLAYSNRAEARLRLLHYEDAFRDAEKSLGIEPMDFKTLVRKGKAAHGLGLYEKACEAFNAALAKSPEHKPILKDLILASTTALKQSTTGQYDLSDFYLSMGLCEVPSCADFVGPLDIRRVVYGHGRRGLFATRNVKPGELLLVSNPLAVYEHNISNWDNSSAEKSLISALLERSKTSKRHMAQLCSLCRFGGKGEMEIPSMDLFRAGSHWLPDDGWEKSEVDANLIRRILGLNTMEKVAKPTCEISMGIWALPSFANHSCSPNVHRAYIGDAVSFRASKNIGNGKELTISYVMEN